MINLIQNSSQRKYKIQISNSLFLKKLNQTGKNKNQYNLITKYVEKSTL